MTDAHLGAADRWVEISVQVPAADVDLVADVLLEFAPGGVAIHPVIRIDDGGEFAFEELPEPVRVAAAVALPLTDADRRLLAARLAALPLTRALGPITYRDVATQDWAEEWKRFYTLQRIGRRLIVHPSWEPYEAAEGEVVVALDPGAAFGTAQHETTRLCLVALDRHVTDGIAVLDVGTGSGVLAIAALKLGAREVRALDTDAGAIVVAQENARRNGVDDRLRAAAGSLGDGWPWPEPAADSANIVVANISANVVVALMPEFVAALRPGGLLIASGFIARDEPEVIACAGEMGLRVLSREREGDWRCFTASVAS